MQEPPPDLRAIFADALTHHQAGHLNEAERLYRQILQVDSHHYDALHLLGVIAHQVGRDDIAVDLIVKAISLNSQAPHFHNSLGNALKEQGKLDDAVASYERALAYRPDYVEALYNLGLVLQKQGNIDEAAAFYRRALTHKPEYAEAHGNLALTLKEQGKLDEAVASYMRALAYKPDYAEAHSNLGNALREQGKLDEAVASYNRALDHKPNSGEVHNNLGNILEEQGKLDEAVASYMRALAHKPNSAEVHNNLGTALREQGKLDEAVASYGRALAYQPDYVEAHNNLGLALKRQGKLDEAVASYKRALLHKPDYAEAHSNLGILLLLTGQFEEGWQEIEWRWRRKDFPSLKRDFQQPLWQGENLEGKTILLHAEQGMGDAIQFCRYVPLVAARGGRVILEVYGPLMRLLGRLQGVKQIVTTGDPLPPIDLHCPLMSLPQFFGTRVDSIPAQIPYLTADPHRVAAWGDRLTHSCFRIGIVWPGGRTYDRDRDRSIPAASFAPLMSSSDASRVQFFSLQKHGPAPPEDFPLIDFMSEIEDFADSAALIANLDLVISVDTAVAHLAAAMGKPVWLLNRFDSCWRWLRCREDSPWYPTMRLFRQSFPGDWTGVIERVVQELRGLGI